jgi:toxin ParE1/3/4
LKRRRYKLTRAARTDLLHIWNYLAESASFDVADKVIADLANGMDRVAETPGLGHERSDLTDKPVKFHRVHRYLIIYAASPVVIVRVLHSSRDVRSLLQ